jgi:hypothetical protein
VASHTEKISAAAVGLPLFLIFAAAGVEQLIDNWATSTGMEKIICALFITLLSLALAVWLIALFVKQRRWTWVVRFLVQFFLFACGVLFGVLSFVTTPSMAGRLVGMFASCYLLILPSVFSLLHLMATAGAIFARRRKALSFVAITDRAAQ